MENIFDRFRLLHEREDHHIIVENIKKGVSFKGTNLWILIFAIFIASLGLNVNSTAVIIGAMLISPLMGPIMGLGLAAGINDLALLRRSLSNFGYAVLVGLATSTFYFLLTPLNDAHSELLARTYPTIYDVLIAFFGGLAGIIATSSKLKGNVIPGVAIATALMPPLCTAGYGLATLHWNYFFGAFYLFLINSVFIAVATLLTVRLLKLPHKHLPDIQDEIRAKRIIATIIIITLIPSVYLGYDIVQQDRFTKKANRFVEMECVLPNDYLLNKKIDVKTKSIILTYGGKEISAEEISILKSKLEYYDLKSTWLEIKQGFSYLRESNESNNQLTKLSQVLSVKEAEIYNLKHALDSINSQNKIGKQIYDELKIEYPSLRNIILNASASQSDTSLEQSDVFLTVLDFMKPISGKEKEKIEGWLKVRLKEDHMKVIFE
jgi:uncharacterized hydrophobic protein (TIGR00271 family)